MSRKEVLDLMRFREKSKRNETALDYMNDSNIEILDMHLFETDFEFSIYLRYNEL